MFGNKVTDFSIASSGSYGYTTKVNLSSLLFYSVTEVQAQNSADSTPVPVSGEVSREAIQRYLNDVNCPDLAFNYAGGEAIIFFKKDVYPYEDTIRFAAFGLRNPQKMTSDSDVIDCPDKYIGLVKTYAISELNATKDIRTGGQTT